MRLRPAVAVAAAIPLLFVASNGVNARVTPLMSSKACSEVAHTDLVYIDALGTTGEPSHKPRLAIDGIRNDGSLGSRLLRFAVKVRGRADHIEKGEAMFITPDHRVIQMRSFWNYDQATCSFNVQSEDLKRLLIKLRPGKHLMIFRAILPGVGTEQSFHTFITVKPSVAQ